MRQRYGLSVLVAMLIAMCCLAALAFAASLSEAAPWPGTVHGTVTNAETGKAVADVTVELLDASSKRVSGPVKSDKGGGFSLKAPQPGEYTVSTKHEGYEPLAMRITIGLDPLPAMALKLNEYHVIDVPPDPPGAGEDRTALAALLGTLLPGLAIGLLLIVGAAKSRDLRNHN